MVGISTDFSYPSTGHVISDQNILARQLKRAGESD